MTVYAFSTENWNRPKEEVNSLMKLLNQYLNQYLKDSKNSNIKIDVIGDISKFDKDTQDKIKQLQELTYNKSGLNLHIALNYGSRDEITRAIKKIISDATKSKINIEDINASLISNYLDTNGIPDPDLLIRTSGEKRISNFLLWQIAYSELFFSEKLWPDFDENDLYEAILNIKTEIGAMEVFNIGGDLSGYTYYNSTFRDSFTNIYYFIWWLDIKNIIICFCFNWLI